MLALRGLLGKEWDLEKGEREENVWYPPQPSDCRNDEAAPRARQGDNRVAIREPRRATRRSHSRRQELGLRQARAAEPTGAGQSSLKGGGTGGWTPRGQQRDRRWETAFVGAPPSKEERK